MQKSEFCLVSTFGNYFFFVIFVRFVVQLY